jgi:predicted phosphodiesterase
MDFFQRLVKSKLKRSGNLSYFCFNRLHEGINEIVILGDVLFSSTLNEIWNKALILLTGKNDDGGLLVYLSDFLDCLEPVQLTLFTHK